MNTNRDDILYYLAALRLERIGPVRLRQWLKDFGDLKNLMLSSTETLLTAGLKQSQIDAIRNVDWQKAENDLQWCEKNNCHIITDQDPNYPNLLRQLPDAPILLFVRGDPSILSQPQLAIVGSRNPTITGKELSEEFACCLTQSGLVITSGLALGIDAASHRGALQAKGKTIAVCGSGLKHIYPATNRKLAEEIIQNGALISELPPDLSPKANFFPMRNRLISGLSLGVLIVEAALRSGSLITAQFAVDQGREVFAIPGSIHNPLTRGCHWLIRQGAKLVETAYDILEELASTAIIRTKDVEKNQSRLDSDEDNKSKLTLLNQKLLKKIGYEMTSWDAIITRSGLTAAELSSMLLSLELEGYITTVPGGYIRNPYLIK